MYQSSPELIKLQKEQATVEQQLKQLQHKQRRLENRKSYYEKADRKTRTHRPLPERIDHRSYERQGVDILPTIHEGPSVCQMEAKGIRTDKGEFNRWIKATNSVIRDIKKKIAALLDWLKEVKEELAKPQTPDLFALLQAYFDQRNSGAYSQRAKANNLKEYSQLCQYLLDHGITDITTLEAHVSNLRATTDSLKKKLDDEAAAIVRQIFAWCMEGYDPSQIAHKLKAAEVDCPTVHWAKMGRNAPAKAPDDPYDWAPRTISGILEKPEYLGHMVNFRTHRQSYKSKKKIENPQSEWQCH